VSFEDKRRKYWFHKSPKIEVIEIQMKTDKLLMETMEKLKDNNINLESMKGTISDLTKKIFELRELEL